MDPRITPCWGDQLRSPPKLQRREIPSEHVCERCGTTMFEHHCKIVCPNCGYKRDCSDP